MNIAQWARTQDFTKIMKWFLTIAAIFFLAAGMYFGFLGHASLLFTGGVGFAGLLLAANLDRVSEFKASKDGFEARTHNVIARAEFAVKELHVLAIQVAELSLSLVKRQGRLGGYSDDEEETIRSSVLSVLRKLGVSEETDNQILREWHQIVEFDYVGAILGGNFAPERATNEQIAEWKSLRNGGITSYPSPNDIRMFLSKSNYLTTEIEERIQDYEHYIIHKTHRRINEWKNRENWGHLRKT